MRPWWETAAVPAGQWGSSSLGTLVILWKSSWQALQKCVVPKQKKTATEQQYRHLYSRKSVPCLEHILEWRNVEHVLLEKRKRRRRRRRSESPGPVKPSPHPPELWRRQNTPRRSARWGRSRRPGPPPRRTAPRPQSRPAVRRQAGVRTVPHWSRVCM